MDTDQLDKLQIIKQALAENRERIRVANEFLDNLRRQQITPEKAAQIESEDNDGPNR